MADETETTAAEGPAAPGAEAPPATRTGGHLGTFAGVFTPSVLTILGIILFLRLGYVVGAGGLVRALLIVVIANTISVLTSFSISAVATNLRVKAGGDYYLISRTLGVGYGGALGLVLFLSQAISIAFYAIGFGEAVAAILGASHLVAQGIAGGAVVLLFFLAWLGSDWGTRFQYVVMVVLFAAIASFGFGAWESWDGSRIGESLSGAEDVPFWILFAIFFPAVTGFTQGVSMSGDLKNPARSIPLGTFLAVGLSFLVYLGVTVAFAGALPVGELAADFGAMRRVSHYGWLADAGVVAATLSSALASFLGAPRILQALAADRVFPVLRFFEAGSGPTNNPRRGVVFAGLIALATVAVGQLNLIAPVVSMFFLISYGLLNYATYAEADASSPSFRPTFRWFDKRASLLGALACLGAMIALSPMAAAVSIAILFGIHQYLKRTVRVERWADSSRSHRFQRVRENLEAISAEVEHSRDWRPVILALSDDPARRARLLELAGWIEGRSGLTTLVQLLITSEVTSVPERRRRRSANATLREEIKRLGIPAFERVVSAADFEAGLTVTLQAYGIGPIDANTVVLNAYDSGDADRAESVLTADAFGQSLRTARSLGFHLVLLHATSEGFERIATIKPKKRRVDVLFLDDSTGRLMLLFAYLMTRTEAWSNARIRVLAPLDDGETEDAARERMEARLDEVRIAAEVEFLPGFSTNAIASKMADASLLFLPFGIREGRLSGPGGRTLEDLADSMPPIVFCLAAEDVDLASQPEEGVHSEIAGAQDAAEEAARRARASDEGASSAAREAERTRKALERAERKGEAPEVVAKLEKEAARAESEEERAQRKALKAQYKSDTATREAEEIATGEAPPAPKAEEEPEPGPAGPAAP